MLSVVVAAVLLGPFAAASPIGTATPSRPSGFATLLAGCSQTSCCKLVQVGKDVVPEYDVGCRVPGWTNYTRTLSRRQGEIRTEIGVGTEREVTGDVNVPFDIGRDGASVCNNVSCDQGGLVIPTRVDGGYACSQRPGNVNIRFSGNWAGFEQRDFFIQLLAESFNQAASEREFFEDVGLCPIGGPVPLPCSCSGETVRDWEAPSWIQATRVTPDGEAAGFMRVDVEVYLNRLGDACGTTLGLLANGVGLLPAIGGAASAFFSSISQVACS